MRTPKELAKELVRLGVSYRRKEDSVELTMEGVVIARFPAWDKGGEHAMGEFLQDFLGLTDDEAEYFRRYRPS